MKKSIRALYEQFGVKSFYKEYGDVYTNPHTSQVRQLIEENETKLDYSKVLDLACGGGEVSQVLQDLKYDNFSACDPYTAKLYEKLIEKPCMKWSFLDIVKGKLTGEYSCIICSFAMHLCPEDLLYDLCLQLFQHSPSLVIISPHKRPKLEELDGLALVFEDHALTERGKKVRLKAYKSSFI